MFSKKKKLKGIYNKKQIEILEFYSGLPLDVIKQKKQKRNDFLKKVCSASVLLVIVGGLLRMTGVIEKTNLYTNNEEDIQNNLNVIGYSDQLFLKSSLNGEIVIRGQKNLTVGIDETLGEEQIKAAKEATEIMNNILQGLNPEYSIKVTTVDKLNYMSCDIPIVKFNEELLKLKTKVFDAGLDYSSIQMSTLPLGGFYNSNVIYKSSIFVNTKYWERNKQNTQGSQNYDEMVTVYLHEMCHGIFGFSDKDTIQYSIMDYGDQNNIKTLYCYDLLNAAAAICDLTNEEEKTRVYNYICSELMKQLESDKFNEVYKSQVANKIAELQASLALEMN